VALLAGVVLVARAPVLSGLRPVDLLPGHGPAARAGEDQPREPEKAKPQ
jgi:hypothetical protein